MTSKVSLEIIIAGDGKNFPQTGQTVSVHYTGYVNLTKEFPGLILKLENGKEWDSSRKRGRPFKFRLGVGEVITGWDEGVSQMSRGERARITVPPDLAYGSKGFPGLIPPDSTIILDVELLGFS